jgi:hypothetical protein
MTPIVFVGAVLVEVIAVEGRGERKFGEKSTAGKVVVKAKGIRAGS